MTFFGSILFSTVVSERQYSPLHLGEGERMSLLRSKHGIVYTPIFLKYVNKTLALEIECDITRCTRERTVTG